MRFRQKTLIGIRDQLSRLGLADCDVCETGNLGLSDYPVILSFGGLPHDEGDPRHDPEANIYYAVKIECNMCGQMKFFNAERFHHGDEPILFLGTREYEAEVDPPDAAT